MLIANLNRQGYQFQFGGVTATAPSRDLTDNQKKEEGGLKQRRKQKEAAQGDPEPKKGNQEKEKTQGKSSFTWSSLELWELSTKTIQTNYWQTFIWITIRFKKLTHKLNEHSIRHAFALIKTRYALQYNTSNNSQGLGPGATAHNPPDPH